MPPESLGLAAPRGPVPAQPLPHHGRRGARRRGPRCGSCASTSARRPSCSSATRRALGRARAAAGAAARRAGARARSPPRCAARGARVVHAHNLNPAFGWRALAAARAAGARVVLHLHHYRLVCAVGMCFNAAARTARAATGRNTLPGRAPELPRQPRAEAVVYAAVAGAVAAAAGRAGRRASSCRARFARERLRALGAPLDAARVHVVAPRGARVRRRARAAAAGELRAGGRRGWRPRRASTSRSTPARAAGSPLVVAGDGPAGAALRARRGGATCASPGARRRRELAELRARRRRSRSCPRARPRPSAWPPPRRWPPACRWWPPRRRAARAGRRRRARAARRRRRARRRRAGALRRRGGRPRRPRARSRRRRSRGRRGAARADLRLSRF